MGVRMKEKPERKAYADNMYLYELSNHPLMQNLRVIILETILHLYLNLISDRLKATFSISKDSIWEHFGSSQV